MKKLLTLLLSACSVVSVAAQDQITVSGHQLDLNSFVDNSGNTAYVAGWNNHICVNCLVFDGVTMTKTPKDEDVLIFMQINERNPNVGWVVSVAKKGKSLDKNKKIKSELGTYEIDCANGKVRLVETSVYGGYFLQGDMVLHDQNIHPWTYARPGSYLETLLIFACRK